MTSDRCFASHPPEEAAQGDVALGGGPQLLQQQVEALHSDPLLQELTAQLGKQVAGPLPATHTYTHTHNQPAHSPVLRCNRLLLPDGRKSFSGTGVGRSAALSPVERV